MVSGGGSEKVCIQTGPSKIEKDLWNHCSQYEEQFQKAPRSYPDNLWLTGQRRLRRGSWISIWVWKVWTANLRSGKLCDPCKSGNHFSGLDWGWSGSVRHSYLLLQCACLRKLPFCKPGIPAGKGVFLPSVDGPNWKSKHHIQKELFISRALGTTNFRTHR